MKARAFALGLVWALALAAASLRAEQSTVDSTNGATIEQTETNIARVTAALLYRQHYSHRPLDSELASRFLDRYLDTLDHQHSYFLQSDLDEFEPFRTNINLLTLRGDVSPGFSIFNRFIERAQQRISYVSNLLAADSFDFTDSDRFIADRSKLPSPKNIAEAQALWREEVRFEYLQEKLQAPNMKYSGPASADSGASALIRLARDKAHPLSFEYLPTNLFKENGGKLGSVSIENESNALLRVDAGPDISRFDTKFYSDKGAELGRVSIRARTNDTAAASNAPFIGAIQINQKNMAEVHKTLTNRYTQLLRNFKEFDREDILELYLNSLTRAYDPHSDYMSHPKAENFNIAIHLSFTGIGAVLKNEDGYCKIDQLTPEGPAFNDGRLKPGDRIIAVAQGDKEPVDIVGMKLTKVVEKIRGEKGTKVRLTIIPASAGDSSAREIIELTRDQVKFEDQEAKARIYDMPDETGKPRRLGLIDLQSFYGNLDSDPAVRKSPTTDISRLLKRLAAEHVEGVILDLRRNGGGLLEEAVSVTGLFISKGPVVQTKEPVPSSRDSRYLIVTASDTDESIAYDGPLIVLVSKGSASASEILAGALQDWGRAIIVGDRTTYGKGTVQSVQNLKPIFEDSKLPFAYDPGEVKLTIRKFYRAGGASTQSNGVASDIELPSVLSYYDIGERSMEYALPWDEVPSANPQNLNRVAPYLAGLREKSSRRVAKDKDFDYIREDIDEYKKSQEDKSVSLNEAARIAEKQVSDARQEARKSERQARPKIGEKVYEITLKNVDAPELQPPVVKTNIMTAARTDIDPTDELPEPALPASLAQDPTLEEALRILADYADAMRDVTPKVSAVGKR